MLLMPSQVPFGFFPGLHGVFTVQWNPDWDSCRKHLDRHPTLSPVIYTIFCEYRIAGLLYSFLDGQSLPIDNYTTLQNG